MFYFLRVGEVTGSTYTRKRNACREAKRLSKKYPRARITVWYRDAIGQNIPINWRG
jgi:hypothetical protein